MKQQSEIKLYAPRYWGYWLMLAVLWLLVQLPQRVRMFIGAQLGKVLFVLLPYRRHISLININKVFADKSEEQRQVIIRGFCHNLGRGLIETGMSWFLPDKKLKKLCRLEADTAALALINNPKTPVILIGMHSTLLELGLRLLGLHMQSAGMYQPLKGQFFNEWIKRQRSRTATELVHFQDMRHTLRILQAGGNIWYALDQDKGPRVSVFVPFFGISAASVNILPKLHARTGAHAIPVTVWREADNRYVVKVLPELKLQQNESDVQVMRRVNQIFEQEICLYPEQYYWVHRRFKNSPEGGRDQYI